MGKWERKKLKRTCSCALIQTPEVRAKILSTIKHLNPIGLLQETCMVRHWILPEYIFSERDQNKIYAVECKLGRYKTNGKCCTSWANSVLIEFLVFFFSKITCYKAGCMYKKKKTIPVPKLLFLFLSFHSS